MLTFICACAIMTLVRAQSPAIFMDGIVSTNLGERDMAISPDGTEMFYTIQSNQHVMSTIIRRHKTSATAWSSPAVASFSGTFSDLEPAFSPDGKRLFFSSNRPLSPGKTKDYDVWVTEKTGSGWSAPKNLGAPINTSANEFYPSVTNDGNIYFTAEYQNGVGKEDIFMSQYKDNGYSLPVPVDTAVNSKLWEFNAFVSPDESFILFTSYGRKDDQGGGDLYISVKKDGRWQPAVNLVSINSPQLDYCPFVSNGKLYFTSGRHAIKSLNEKATTYAELVKSYNGTANGSENIYWLEFSEVMKRIP